MKVFIVIILIALPNIVLAENFTSYFSGNTNDAIVSPSGGVCLMGGATEDDSAMRWFLKRANGGDILVLRASGADGYNNYFYSELGVQVNSVETIVFHNRQASYDEYILRKIDQAEAIWFAGGDQWKYVSYWRGTPLDSAINRAIAIRNIAIGGTSAGMAILGNFYFTAQNGTVTSQIALANPFNNLVTIDSTAFIKNKFLINTITDSHFDNPNRKGRLVAFMARIFSDYGVFAKAIACDEYTAVCIDTNGIARVFGNYPKYDDNAYFIQSNCELLERSPENCTVATPLTWYRQAMALKAYQIKGDSLGSNYFDLNNWQNASGGKYYDWSVQQGVFAEKEGLPINCSPNSTEFLSNKIDFELFPNPTNENLIIKYVNNQFENLNVFLFDQLGQITRFNFEKSNSSIVLSLNGISNGIYYLVIMNGNYVVYKQKILKF
jgi:cyanophycinase-like exopeptidase